tara:strand:- start:5493 stop:6116 length:624 start_codon:yes stop_codon:yes gene_type:complete
VPIGGGIYSEGFLSTAIWRKSEVTTRRVVVGWQIEQIKIFQVIDIIIVISLYEDLPFDREQLMSVTLRLATMDDLSQCLELINVLVGVSDMRHEVFDAGTFSDFVSNLRGSVVIAEEGGEVLGMASVSYNLALRHNGEYCQLEELVVDPKARGKNVGGLLVEESIRRARARGCKEFGLYLLESTKHNEPFYAKYGFTVVGEEMRQLL